MVQRLLSVPGGRDGVTLFPQDLRQRLPDVRLILHDQDTPARAGIRLPSLAYTGFGAGWFDIDNDGWLDLLTVNGAVTQSVESLARREKFSLQQRKQLFERIDQLQEEIVRRYKEGEASVDSLLR